MDFLDEVIEREGGDRETNDPADAGGRTKFGISERANPEAWTKGPPSRSEAREIYRQRYVVEPGFDRIAFVPLRENLIDFGVTSGPARAILFLQTILGVQKDAVIGPQTLAALAKREGRDVNNQLVVMREQFYRRLGEVRPANQKFVKGWVRRAQLFWLACVLLAAAQSAACAHPKPEPYGPDDQADAEVCRVIVMTELYRDITSEELAVCLDWFHDGHTEDEIQQTFHETGEAQWRREHWKNPKKAE